MRPDQLQRRLRERLDAVGPASPRDDARDRRDVPRTRRHECDRGRSGSRLAHGLERGVVTPFHPSTEGFGAPIRVGIGPTDVATGLGLAWVTNQGGDTLSRIDPITGEVETIPIGGPAAAVAIDDLTETVWVVFAQASRGPAG